MKVLVGSQNPVKVDATELAFAQFFETVEVISVAVSSTVSAQPIEDETFVGAEQRAEQLKALNETQHLHAQFFVGIEGGIKKLRQRWFAFGAICILDTYGRRGYGTTPFFELPNAISAELLTAAVVELGDVMDRVTGEENTKQKQGAVGFFTRGVLSRKEYYVVGLTVALIPFLNPEVYFR